MHSIKSLVIPFDYKKIGNQFRFVRDEVAMVSHVARIVYLYYLTRTYRVRYSVWDTFVCAKRKEYWSTLTAVFKYGELVKFVSYFVYSDTATRKRTNENVQLFTNQGKHSCTACISVFR